MKSAQNMTENVNNDICLQIEDLIPEYALGLLDPHDVDRVASTIGNCPEQALQLAAMEDAVGLIGLAAPAVQVPATLWNRLENSTVDRESDSSNRIPASFLAASNSRFKSRMNVPRWVAGLAAVLILMLVASTVTMGYAVRHEDSPNRSLESTMAFYMTSGGSVIPLSSQSGPDGWAWSGKGALIVAPNMPPVLVVDNCESAQNGSAYVVWLSTGGKRTGMGQLTVDEQGRGMLTITGIDSLDSYDTIGVSLKMTDGGIFDLIEGPPHQDI
jgi:hypothetical protein